MSWIVDGLEEFMDGLRRLSQNGDPSLDVPAGMPSRAEDDVAAHRSPRPEERS